MIRCEERSPAPGMWWLRCKNWAIAKLAGERAVIINCAFEVVPQPEDNIWLVLDNIPEGLILNNVFPCVSSDYKVLKISGTKERVKE